MGNENCSYCYKRDNKSEDGQVETMPPSLFDSNRLQGLRNSLVHYDLQQLRCSLYKSSFNLNETNATLNERGDNKEENAENMNDEPCIMNSIESYNKTLFLEKMKAQR